MTDHSEMTATLEAVLFVAPEPVSRGKLLELFPEDEREQAEEALQEILERYQSAPEQDTDGRGVVIEEVAGGLRLTTRPHLNDWLRRFFEANRGKKLSMGALETLAIVAYRQPITAPEIQELRSVSPSGVLKTLLERRMIRIAGRKEVVGKPFLYTTTQDFLIHFGLLNLRDLPPLEEFEEALAGEGLGELLAGPDEEEQVLQASALLEDAEGDEADEADERLPEEMAAHSDGDFEETSDSDPEGDSEESPDAEAPTDLTEEEGEESTEDLEMDEVSTDGEGDMDG